eukprot:1600132-Alexandrium_andersonii.AAC.1
MPNGLPRKLVEALIDVNSHGALPDTSKAGRFQQQSMLPCRLCGRLARKAAVHRSVVPTFDPGHERSQAVGGPPPVDQRGDGERSLTEWVGGGPLRL